MQRLLFACRFPISDELPASRALFATQSHSSLPQTVTKQFTVHLHSMVQPHWSSLAKSPSIVSLSQSSEIIRRSTCRHQRQVWWLDNRRPTFAKEQKVTQTSELYATMLGCRRSPWSKPLARGLQSCILALYKLHPASTLSTHNTVAEQYLRNQHHQIRVCVASNWSDVKTLQDFD